MHGYRVYPPPLIGYPGTRGPKYSASMKCAPRTRDRYPGLGYSFTPSIRVPDSLKPGIRARGYPSTRGPYNCEYQVLLATLPPPPSPPPSSPTGYSRTRGPTLCEHELLFVPATGTRSPGTHLKRVSGYLACLNRVSREPAIRLPVAQILCEYEGLLAIERLLTIATHPRSAPTTTTTHRPPSPSPLLLEPATGTRVRGTRLNRSSGYLTRLNWASVFRVPGYPGAHGPKTLRV